MAEGKLKWIGKNIKRVQSERLVAGRGKFVADIELANMKHAAVVHSTEPHARIVSIDTSKAKALPGVIAVFTGAELALHTTPLPTTCEGPIYWPVVAVDKVRYLGESVAVVVAETREIAEDGCELVEVVYDPLPLVMDVFKAMEPDAPLIHEIHGSNIAFHRKLTFGEVEKHFAEADHVFRDRLLWSRTMAMPLETNGAVADWDSSIGVLTIYVPSQMLNIFGHLLADCLKIPANKLNFVPLAAGGNFGTKTFLARQIVLTGLCSKLTNYPVKFAEDRYEHISNGDAHGSDRVYEVEFAVSNEGIFESLRFKVIDNYGAYLIFGVGTHANSLSQITGPYKIKSCEVDLYAVMTNRCQQSASRGFGSDCGNFILESMVNLAARELKMDPVEIRRKNLIQPEEFPYKIPTGNEYDSGNYPAVMDKALEMFDMAKWRRKQEEGRKEGRYIGIGWVSGNARSTYNTTEFWFLSDDERVALRTTTAAETVELSIDQQANFTVLLNSPSIGNSPETVAQLAVAEEFDIDPERVSVLYTTSTHHGISVGATGSRQTVMVAGAVKGAANELKRRLFKVAAYKLEANAEDMVVAGGKVYIKGSPDKSMTIEELAQITYLRNLEMPRDVSSGLHAMYTYDQPYSTMPSKDRSDLGIFYPMMGHGVHIPVVEVDIETGLVKVFKYVAVHDHGTVVSPDMLKGQIAGGIAQGIGMSIMEQVAYDDKGQLLTPNLIRYLIPNSLEVPPPEIGFVETPSPWTAYGVKGAGEAPRIISPAAMAMAIEDALSPFGIRVRKLPIFPHEIVKLVQEAKERATETTVQKIGGER